MFRTFRTSRKANMALLMMGTLAGVALVAGGAVDYASLASQNRNIQSVADGAALAAAREMVIVKATNERVQSIAEAYVAANYNGGAVKTQAVVLEGGHAVQVTLSAAPVTYFPGPVALNARNVTGEATAEISGSGNVCMVGLDRSAPSTLNMMNSARLSAPNCAIYSNSTSTSSLRLANFARVSAQLTCVAGGVSGAKSAVFPAAIEDCPVIEDPLKDHPDPKLGLLPCTQLKPLMIATDAVLDPGVYCGGITVVAGASVKLNPGIYTMVNGGLTVTADGTLEGDNVAFYLSGAASTIFFAGPSHISLSAPKTGPLAGILFFEDRSTVFRTYHQITSNDARRLVGTMYFPNSRLKIDANNPVADRSEYTVIVAREFDLSSGPELVLKTDYDASPIPLPEGVGNKAKPAIRLSH